MFPFCFYANVITCVLKTATGGLLFEGYTVGACACASEVYGSVCVGQFLTYLRLQPKRWC